MNKLFDYAKNRLIKTKTFGWKNRKIAYNIFDDGDDNPDVDATAFYDGSGNIYISSLVSGEFETLRKPIAVHEYVEFMALKAGNVPVEIITREKEPGRNAILIEKAHEEANMEAAEYAQIGGIKNYELLARRLEVRFADRLICGGVS